eukprot:scaffold198127_cov38-Attheya_sp.AAC.1
MSVGTPWTRRIEIEPIKLISSNIKRRGGKKNPADIIAVTRRALGSYGQGGSKEIHLTHFQQMFSGLYPLPVGYKLMLSRATQRR